MRKRFFIKSFFLVTAPVLLSIMFLFVCITSVVLGEEETSILYGNQQSVDGIRQSIELIFNEVDVQSLNFSTSAYPILQLDGVLIHGYSSVGELDAARFICSYLDSTVNSKPYLYSIYLYTENSSENFFASGTGLANRDNFLDTEWFAEAASVPKETSLWISIRQVDSLHSGGNAVDLLTIYKRLYRSGENTPSGLLILNLRQDYFERYYTNQLMFPEQAVYLLDQDGDVISHSEECQSLSKEELSLLSSDSHRYFVARAFLPSYGCSLISVIPRSILLTQALTILHPMLLSILFAALMGVLTAYYVSHQNMKSVRNISRMLDAMENDKSPVEIDPPSDEYERIVQIMVRHFTENRNLKVQLAERSNRAEQLYFSFLQSQLSPHFLSNTLRNIFWKTVRLTNGINDASRMIDLLTMLLEYAYVSPNKMVTVQQEIEKTKCYLEIQQMRFESHFTVEWSYDESVCPLPCIKFALQPLVENSVSHGMVKSAKGGRIHISIQSTSDGTLAFQVVDNGRGFTPERLAKVTATLQSDNVPAQGIGLYNLNKRLTLVYGDQAALHIKSIPDEETRISFTIPTNPAQSVHLLFDPLKGKIDMPDTF